QLRGDLDTELVTTVENVNRLTQQIATLNVKIQSERKGPGQVAGDLEDEQGHMIDELSRLITISVRENSDGTTTISAPQGLLLVDHGVSNDLGTRAATNNGAVVSFLTQAADGRAVEPAGGHLKGLITARDEKLVNYRQSMDELAQTLVGRLNAIHAGGFGLDGSSGTNFFTSVQTSARLIDVSSEIRADLNKIAASGSATGSGDGSNALALSDLRTTKVLGSGNQTLEEFYSGLVGRVGAEARDIFTSAESQRLVSEQVQTRRENMRGVSINEEATSLILFQRAYQAAARIVTAVDEMMQAALNM
ncbi:MAG: flagellar hook-associated protein FlgK, partial [bacterium]|nr:flagellar hook-associated protein FlgK [bacterium]